jgi:hypothetical protein
VSEARIAAELRQSVILRAHSQCEYCWSQVRFATQAFSVEHIIPRSKGGETVLENLALSCQGCNNHKYNKIAAVDPINGQAMPLYHPRQHVWEEHFRWNEDYTLILGITGIGRTTVESLNLNRSGVVNLRRILYAAGEHPLIQRRTDSQN